MDESAGQLKKMEKDFTKEVDDILPIAKNLFQVTIRNFYLNILQGGKLKEALDRLTQLEKQTRNVLYNKLKYFQ